MELLSKNYIEKAFQILFFECIHFLHTNVYFVLVWMNPDLSETFSMPI